MTNLLDKIANKAIATAETSTLLDGVNGGYFIVGTILAVIIGWVIVNIQDGTLL